VRRRSRRIAPIVPTRNTPLDARETSTRRRRGREGSDGSDASDASARTRERDDGTTRAGWTSARRSSVDASANTQAGRPMGTEARARDDGRTWRAGRLSEDAREE
jgi:hypothetical protein